VIPSAANQLTDEGLFEPHFRDGFLQLYNGYRAERAARDLPLEPVEEHFANYLNHIERHLRAAHPIEPIHRRIEELWRLGLTHVDLMLDRTTSKAHGLEHARRIWEQTERGDNVILFSNHQTELDCHLVSQLIGDELGPLVEKMIWVAGDRVVTDPVAVPVSLGLNLICIYSKNYIDHPPEKKQEKLHHNRQTMRQTRTLLSQGGQCIVLFPSGGRDRPASDGTLSVAPFDPSAIEMFRLLAERSGQTTHFYPLSLATYPFLPPPNEVRKDLGETRICRYVGVQIAFGEEIDFSPYPRRERSEEAAGAVWRTVQERYTRL